MDMVVKKHSHVSKWSVRMEVVVEERGKWWRKELKIGHDLYRVVVKTAWGQSLSINIEMEKERNGIPVHSSEGLSRPPFTGEDPLGLLSAPTADAGPQSQWRHVRQVDVYFPPK